MSMTWVPLMASDMCGRNIVKNATITKMDSTEVHSSIERSSRHQTIYTPEQWLMVVRGARKSKHPCIVTELTFDDILDLMAMSNKAKYFKGGRK